MSREQPPPRYSICGKDLGSTWYLEHTTDLRWDAFESSEEAVKAAWEDWEAVYAVALREVRAQERAIEQERDDLRDALRTAQNKLEAEHREHKLTHDRLRKERERAKNMMAYIKEHAGEYPVDWLKTI